MTTNKNRPVHTVKLGLVEAAIWQNATKAGSRFNVTVSRSYSVETEGDEKPAWRSTDSFGRDDLLTLAKVVDLAHSWICEQAAVKPEAEPTV